MPSKPRLTIARCMLGLTLAAYLALALTYNGTIALNQAPDEPWHYLYVRSLAEGRGLPSLQETHEAQHPPLYYALGALWTRAAGMLLREPPETGEAERREYTYFPRREHALRFLSTLFGLGAILAVYALARRLAPDDPWPAITAPALAAFLPMFTYMTSVVNNDGLVLLLATLLLAQTATFLQEGGARRLPLIGILAGLALLTKDSALALLPLPLLAAGWRARRDGNPKTLLRDVAMVAGPALLLWIAWPVRNLVVHGSPFVHATSKGSDVNNLLLYPVGYFQVFFRRTFTSFAAPEWIVHDQVDLSLYHGGVLLAIAFVAAGLLRRRKRDEGEPWVGLFLKLSLLGLALLLAGVFHYCLFVDYTAGIGGRYLLPLVAAAALLASLGVRALLPLRTERVAAIAGIAAWAMLLAVAVWFLNMAREFYAWV